MYAVPGRKGGPGAEVLHTAEGLRDVSQPHRHHRCTARRGGEGERPGENTHNTHDFIHTKSFILLC